MIDQAVTNGWRVTGLYRRVGKAPGKSAALSLTVGNKQTELTIRIRWRKREESATEPIRKGSHSAEAVQARATGSCRPVRRRPRPAVGQSQQS